MPRRVLPWAAMLAALCLVFGFSSQSGSESQGLSGAIAGFVTMFIPGFADMDPTGQAKCFDIANFVVRRCAHTFEYSALAISAFLAFGDFKRLRGESGRALLRRFAAVMAFVLACALLDEFNQQFSGGRSGLLSDAVYDAATSGLVLAAGLATARRLHSRSNEKQRSRL